MSEPRYEGKSYVIPKRLLWDAWLKVKEKGGSAGADGVTIEQFEQEVKNRLFVLWNRMSSGSYFPGPVRAVDIPKKDGTRRLGIPNIVDRVAQTAAAIALEPGVEQVFHEDSYGYRPGRSPLDAVAVCRERCFKKEWVLDVDIRKFFDSVPWDLTLKALARHTDQKWVMLYVERWLKAPMLMTDGSLVPREKGTPQGSPISPLIANLFLHYGFDAWMAREFPVVKFERFADDVVIHCVSESQARTMCAGCSLAGWSRSGWSFTRRRPGSCIAREPNAGEHYEHVSFTFCGYTFRPRKAKNNRRRETFMGFLPAVSPGKLSEMSRRVASWRLHRRTTWTLDDLAKEVNPVIGGWLAYYTAFYPSAVEPTLPSHRSPSGAMVAEEVQTPGTRASTSTNVVARGPQREPELFVHWRYCAPPR